jgi:hypothetical protein
VSTAAHTGVVRAQGTSTAFTVEPTTKLTANTRYQLVTDAKRLLDPAVALTVEVDADGAGGGAYATAAPATYSVDYMFGIITFLADLGAAATVRVSGSYLPVLDLLGVKSWSIDAKRDELDVTEVNNATGYRVKKLGLRDLSGSIETLELLITDNDPGAGSLKLEDVHSNGTPLLFERLVAGKRFRAWVLLAGVSDSGALADLVSSTVNFTGAARAVGAGYAWEA